MMESQKEDVRVFTRGAEEVYAKKYETIRHSQSAMQKTNEYLDSVLTEMI